MAGLIKREDIATVRERARIEEVVGAHVTLRQAGVGSMKGLCPFHDERTPSFHVRPQLGLWHCFGCDEGGDVISFVQKLDGLSFAEAVEYLANRTGVQLRYEEGSGPARPGGDHGRRQRLVEAHRVAEEFYREQLLTPQAQLGRRFLAERSFTEEAAATFGVGFAPAGWDHLLRHLRGRGFTEPELIASGLVSQGNRGVYDRFRGRLVWPIRDVTGETIGFGARRLSEDDQGPKYLNTPETQIYKKSSVLYGIDLAKRAIAKEKRVVVVEGYTDVMAAHLSGIGTAIATCGTAFGEEHVRIVRRLLGESGDAASGLMFASGATRGGEVIFTFDGDEAGQKAALRAFGEDQKFASQTFVAVEPSGMDPCDLRQQRGEAAVRDLVERREPLFAFAIRSALRRVNLDTAEGRVAGLRAAAPVVAGIRDRALRSEYARELAGWLGMEEHTVRQAVATAERAGGGQGGVAGAPSRDQGRPQGQYGNGRPGDDGASRPGSGPGPAQGRSTRPGREDPVARLERQVLEVVVQLPHLALGAGFDDLPPDTFTVPAYRGVHDAIRAAGGTRTYGAELDRAVTERGREQGERHAAAWWTEMLRENAGGPVAGVVTELAVSPLPEDRPEALGNYARGVLLSLIQMGLTRQIADLRGRLQRTAPDSEESVQVFSELVALENRRRALRTDD
ncbi:DNA primase [Georgenia sp. 311]|uniref:DNA primase n=1 Tax=Georgenia wutianyii TaxID=2585135 RepID=A0ABX5VKH3_9MICO|nr:MULTISPECIES: DNA primase [Georgenia]QDB78946.1 DNA primase [Georgenia wutianyii]TNC19360.1 DNA primase [Georgenia sp. 311]